jgi:hypothetical protein
MRKNFLFSLVVSIVLLLASHPVFAQVTINGRVTESSNGSGVSNVKIYAYPTSQECGSWTGGLVSITNAFGYYFFESPSIYCSMLVAPTKKGRTFTPASIYVTGGIGPYDDLDFVADAQ